MSALSRLRISIAAIALVAAAAVPAAAQEVTGDTVVATLNGEPITGGDLALVFGDIGDQLSQMPPERRQQALLDLVVNIRLAAAAAKAAGLDKNPVVAKRVELVKDRTLYSEYLREKFAAAVTEAAVRKQFEADLAKFVPGDEVHARHILVPTEEEAKAIIAELDKGGKFAEIANAKSKDLGSGKDGGDLGFFSRGRMVKPFEDAAFALDVGKYTTAPVKSDFGWHVILLEEKRKAPPPTFESQAERIQQDLMRATFDSEIEALRKTAKIELVPLPVPPAAPAAPAPAPAQ